MSKKSKLPKRPSLEKALIKEATKKVATELDLPSTLEVKSLDGLAKVKWSSLQCDLKSALGTWDDLDQKPTKKSPEEEQLEKVKTLIEDLKMKLSDF